MSFQRPFLISLKRSDSQQPWGFRIEGGRNQNLPVIIFKVAPNSIAEHAGLHEGDEVIQIGRENVQEMTHDKVQEVILLCGNRLEMFVIREDLLKEPKQGEPRTVKAVVHAQYNSPMDLYSTENVADTLARHAEVIVDGYSESDYKGRSPKSSPVIQRSAVLQALYEDEAKERRLIELPITPPTSMKQPPPPPPKPKPPVRSEILKSSPETYMTSPFHQGFERISCFGSDQEVNRTSTYHHKQQYYGTEVPYKEAVLQGKQTPKEEKKTSTYQQKQQYYPTDRSYTQAVLQGKQATDSYFEEGAPLTPLRAFQSTYPQQQLATTQSPHQHITTTSVQLTARQSNTPPTAGRVEPHFYQPMSPQTTIRSAQPISAQAKGISQISPSSPTAELVQQNYEGQSQQTSSCSVAPRSQSYWPQQNRPASQSSLIRMFPSPTASPSLSRKFRTSEGIWPPKNPKAQEPSRIGFSSGWTLESSQGRKLVWPPPILGETNDTFGGRTTPPRASTVTNVWHPQSYTPPCRTPPFAGGSPLLGRRNKDIVWPPPQSQNVISKRSSSRPLKKTQSFEDYMVQHASVTVPPTYRPPPGSQHVQPSYA